MAVCLNCGKKKIMRTWSRHQKGSSGASEWPLRAQIVKKAQKPNLHTFKGKSYCTKCLRLAKMIWNAANPRVETSVQA
jgi:hypothetical protein